MKLAATYLKRRYKFARAAAARRRPILTRMEHGKRSKPLPLLISFRQTQNADREHALFTKSADYEAGERKIEFVTS